MFRHSGGDGSTGGPGRPGIPPSQQGPYLFIQTPTIETGNKPFFGLRDPSMTSISSMVPGLGQHTQPNINSQSTYLQSSLNLAGRPGGMHGGGLTDMDAMRHQAAMQAGDLRARITNELRNRGDEERKHSYNKPNLENPPARNPLPKGVSPGSKGPSPGKVDFRTRLEEEKRRKKEEDERKSAELKRKKESDARREADLKKRREEDVKKNAEETKKGLEKRKLNENVVQATKSSGDHQHSVKAEDQEKPMAEEEKKPRAVNGTVAVIKGGSDAQNVQIELQKQIGILTQQLQTAKQNLAIQTRLAEERKEQVERVEREVKESRTEARTAREKAEKLNRDLNDANTKLANHKKDFVQLKENLKTREQDKHKLDQEKAKFRMEAARLEGQLSEVRKQADHQVEEAREVARNLHARLHQRENEVMQLQAQISSSTVTGATTAVAPVATPQEQHQQPQQHQQPVTQQASDYLASLAAMAAGAVAQASHAGAPSFEHKPNVQTNPYPNIAMSSHALQMTNPMAAMGNMGAMPGMQNMGKDTYNHGEQHKGNDWIASGTGGSIPPWQQQQQQQQQQHQQQQMMQPPLPPGGMLGQGAAAARGAMALGGPHVGGPPQPPWGQGRPGGSVQR